MATAARLGVHLRRFALEDPMGGNRRPRAVGPPVHRHLPVPKIQHPIHRPLG